MKNIAKLAVASGVLLMAGSVLAENNPPTLINDNQSMIIDSGFYLGANGGYGKVDETVTGSTKSKTAGFAGGLDFGYQFSPYVAAELGAYLMPNESFDHSNTVKGSQNYFAYAAAKGILPFSSGFNVFAKLGGAWVHHKFEGSATAADNGTFTKITAMGGLGVGYNINLNVTVSLQGLATAKSGNQVPANLIGLLGIAYHF